MCLGKGGPGLGHGTASRRVGCQLQRHRNGLARVADLDGGAEQDGRLGSLLEVVDRRSQHHRTAGRIGLDQVL